MQKIDYFGIISVRYLTVLEVYFRHFKSSFDPKYVKPANCYTHRMYYGYYRTKMKNSLTFL